MALPLIITGEAPDCNGSGVVKAAFLHCNTCKQVATPKSSILVSEAGTVTGATCGRLGEGQH